MGDIAETVNDEYPDELEDYDNCSNCKKHRTHRCEEYKCTGRYSGDGDWCSGHKKEKGHADNHKS